MMKIKVLGSGCPKCKEVEKRVKETLENLSFEAEVIKVTDINDIMDYDIMMTPAVVIDEKVKSSGKVPSAEEVTRWIQEERG